MAPGNFIHSISAAVLSLVFVYGVASSPLSAQHPSEFTSRDKTEIFIQHLVKTMKLDPTRYRAMVLEYEIGSALREISPEIAADLDTVDFIQSSLRELYPVLWAFPRSFWFWVGFFVEGVTFSTHNRLK